MEDAEAAGLHNGKLCHAHWDGIQVSLGGCSAHEVMTYNFEGVRRQHLGGFMGVEFKRTDFAEREHICRDTNREEVSLLDIIPTETLAYCNPLFLRCDASHLGWDFIHCNSVDKTADGDYLLSCRHSNTIYKISHRDGSILWRFGGFMSDFAQGDLVFGRQHNIRIREENGTHTIISFLDNAIGQDSAPPSHDFSRGLLIALDEKNMKSTVLKEIAHPDLNYASRRGNYQALPNGNVLMGWSKKALHSEHTVRKCLGHNVKGDIC